MDIVNLSAPWVIYYRKINELFKNDPEIQLVFDEDEVSLKLYVDNATKADALSKLLPTEKRFGNVIMSIFVIPSNLQEESRTRLFEKAFENNPILSYIKTIEGDFSYNTSYIVFMARVVQFFADNLKDVNGNTSTLYEEIARDVFGEENGISFCTAEVMKR